MARYEDLNVTNLNVGGANINRDSSRKMLQVVSGVINFNVASPFTVSLGTIPKGATILHTVVEVSTAFNAGTTNVLVVGNATTDNAYVAAGDVNEAAAGTTIVGKRTALTADTVVLAKYTQTGTAATTGVAVVTVYFSV